MNTNKKNKFFDFNTRLCIFQRLLFTPSNTLILRKPRFISGINQDKYKHKVSPYYTLRHFLREYESINSLFIQRRYERLDYYLKDNETGDYVFISKNVGYKSGYDIVNVQCRCFDLIFPKGLPQNQKDFDKWISHIGFLAKKSHLERVSLAVAQVDSLTPKINDFLDLANFLKENSIDVEQLLRGQQ